jgi:hypothetical protein
VPCKSAWVDGYSARLPPNAAREYRLHGGSFSDRPE